MWRFRLMEFDGTPINEVFDATDRKFIGAINRPATAGFKVRGDHELASRFFTQEDLLLEVWQDSTIRFNGYVTTTNYEDSDTNDAGTIAVNAVDSAWKLAKRLAGISVGGTKYSIDKAKAAYKIIKELENEAIYTSGFVETGIKTSAESAYAASGSGTYTAGPYKSALVCLNDLSNGFDGFDWRFDPLDGEHPKLNLFVAQPVLGETKNVVLERGWGTNNVVNLSYLRDLQNAVNFPKHLPDEGIDAEGATVVTAVNLPSVEQRGRLEETADAYGLVDTTLRTKWVEEVARVRGNPRYVAGMKLARDDGTGRVPTPWTDFEPGDLVTARAVVAGNTLFNGQARVYAIEVEVNDAGAPTYTPILIDEEGDSLAA